MWNHAGETFAGQQEHFRGCRAGLLEPPELLIHVASGTVCSTWSLGVIQIIHINFYTGMSPADALSPKCLETICFLEWGQNSQLLFTSLSSKCPWWVIIGWTWVSREEGEGCGSIAFVWMDWLTAHGCIWHLDYFPSCIFGGLDFERSQSTSDRHLIQTEKTQQIWKWKKNLHCLQSPK